MLMLVITINSIIIYNYYNCKYNNDNYILYIIIIIYIHILYIRIIIYVYIISLCTQFSYMMIQTTRDTGSDISYSSFPNRALQSLVARTHKSAVLYHMIIICIPNIPEFSMCIII